nr:unnamed protein product [Callosobruchus chinensis]CAH7728925.1 unnamed protein product [Callosobruchus chinensis]
MGYQNERKSSRKSINDQEKAYNIITVSRNRTKSAWSLVNRLKGESSSTTKIELNVNGTKITPHKIANEFVNLFFNNTYSIGINSRAGSIDLKIKHTQNLFFKPTMPHEVFDIKAALHDV